MLIGIVNALVDIDAPLTLLLDVFIQHAAQGLAAAHPIFPAKQRRILCKTVIDWDV